MACVLASLTGAVGCAATEPTRRDGGSVSAGVTGCISLPVVVWVRSDMPSHAWGDVADVEPIPAVTVMLSVAASLRGLCVGEAVEIVGDEWLRSGGPKPPRSQIATVFDVVEEVRASQGPWWYRCAQRAPR